MASQWTRLFPAGDFRWSIGLRPGDGRAFFAPTVEREDVLAERARWLFESPGECALLTEDGAPLLRESAALAAEWNPTMSPPASDPCEPLATDTLHRLGRTWEPDFVLLSAQEGGLTVEGGVVCFPSSWALREKLGRTLDFTHSVVPDLNAQVASRIQKALTQLVPGAAWERENWGISRDPERNHSIHRTRRHLDATATPAEVWLRIERQVLVKLPETKGILFAIRLEIVPWTEFVADPEAREGLTRALSSMPDEAARYKGVHEAKPTLLAWLKN